jgi:uncharacterized UBP type Zn finger protein
MPLSICVESCHTPSHKHIEHNRCNCAGEVTQLNQPHINTDYLFLIGCTSCHLLSDLRNMTETSSYNEIPKPVAILGLLPSRHAPLKECIWLNIVLEMMESYEKNTQQDAHEFLRCLLHMAHEDLTKGAIKYAIML